MLALRAATPAVLRSFVPPLRQAFPPRAVSRARPRAPIARGELTWPSSLFLSASKPALGAAALPSITALVPSALANLGVWLMNRNARRPTKVRPLSR